VAHKKWNVQALRRSLH